MGLPSAERLEDALARMRWREEPRRFALLGFAEPPAPEDLALIGSEGPGQLVREGGETTLLVPAEALEAALERHPTAGVERDLCWFRFELAMEWNLVGFLALVTRALADAGVPVGAVCGFSRDHLFVAESYRARTREVLARCFPEASGPA